MTIRDAIFERVDTQVPSFNASNLVFKMHKNYAFWLECNYLQAIITFLCLLDHTIFIQVCSIAISMVSLLLCPSAGDLEESKTTEHSSAIGD